MDEQAKCVAEGNRWSILFALNTATLFLLVVNAGLTIGGAFNFHARGLAACCATLCCCLNLGAIITTGVFRFNSVGSLTALC